MECGQTPEILRLSVELSVRLLNPAPFNYAPPLFLSFLAFFLFSHNVFNTVRMFGLLRPHHVCKPYLGASHTEAKTNYSNGFFPITYEFLFHMCLFFTIICIDMT